MCGRKQFYTFAICPAVLVAPCGHLTDGKKRRVEAEGYKYRRDIAEIMEIYIDPQLGFSKPNIFVWRAFSLTNRCSSSDFSEHSKLVIHVNSTDIFQGVVRDLYIR